MRLYSPEEIHNDEVSSLSQPGQDTELWFPIPKKGGVNQDAKAMGAELKNKKQEPQVVANNLGHSERWVVDINEKRIKGETCRRNYLGFVINLGYKFEDIRPDLTINRLYFP